MGFHVPKTHYMISFPGFRSESEIKDLDPDPITDTHMKGCICIYKTDTSSLIFQKTFYCCVPHQRTNILEKASTCPAYIFFAYRVIDALTRQPSSRRSCTYGDVYQAWKPVSYTYLYLSAKILSGTICKHLSFCMPLNFK